MQLTKGEKEMVTQHAQQRISQRGVPQLIPDLLILYGDSKYIGGQVKVRFFSKRSRKKMSRDLGACVMSQLARFFNTYLVQSIDTGDIVTVAHKQKGYRFKGKS